jgi:hypothetical protein
MTPPTIADRHKALAAFREAMAGQKAAPAISPITVPSFLEKVGHFATSAVKHVAAGAPRCTDEQVAARHAICSGCEYFDGKACKKCGCPVVRERAYISKLSWAGESCPAGKWGPVSPAG